MSALQLVALNAGLVATAGLQGYSVGYGYQGLSRATALRRARDHAAGAALLACLWWLATGA